MNNSMRHPGAALLLFTFILFSCDKQNEYSGMDPIERTLRKEVDRGKTPSIQYLIFSQDSIIRSVCNGKANVSSGIEVDKNTTYSAFSVTKTFTALAILQLAEKGKIDIDELASNYLPDFPYEGEITIRQLLVHTAGIPNPNPLSWVHLAEEHKGFDRRSFFKEVFNKHNKVKSEPNHKFRYTNLGYVILGQLIEEVSGLRYEDYVREMIINPAGIESGDLDFEVNDKSRYAKGYIKKNSFLNLILGFFMDKSRYMEAPEGPWKPFKKLYLNGAAYGGLIGNASGFARYIQQLIKEDSPLISDTFKEMMFTENITTTGKSTGMCLSWFTGKLNGITYYSHAGGGGGYYCEIRIYPEIGIGSVVMLNKTGVSDARMLDKVDVHYLRNL
jgi:CubicO group peptidase (beta-lactamase class C family)